MKECTLQNSSADQKMEKESVKSVNTSDLDGLEQWTRTAPNFTTSPQGEAFGEQLREVIRLARVGLEAENLTHCLREDTGAEIMQEHDYRLELCRIDGTTLPGQTVRVNVMAVDHYQATQKAFKMHPEHELVSWGWESDIRAMEERNRLLGIIPLTK